MNVKNFMILTFQCTVSWLVLFCFYIFELIKCQYFHLPEMHRIFHYQRRFYIVLNIIFTIMKVVFPGQRRTAGNARFHGIPEISWKQYSGERIRWPDLSGFARNRQEPVKTGSRIRSPDPCVAFLALPGGFRPEKGSFLRVFARNSRNTASGIIDLGYISSNSSC